MKRVLLALVGIGLAAVVCRAAELGRKATLHLHDGTVLKCVVLGYADGKFEVEDSGEKKTVEVTTVDKVIFGEAVGENLRGPLDPPRYHEPTTAPASVRPEDHKRPLKDALKRLEAHQQTIRFLWFATGHFEDTERLAKVETELKGLIAASEKGQENKNLKLALATVKVAQRDFDAARTLLDELKKEYPGDEALQKLTVIGLGQSVDRWRRFDPARLPKRPGSRGGGPRPEPGTAPRE